MLVMKLNLAHKDLQADLIWHVCEEQEDYIYIYIYMKLISLSRFSLCSFYGYLIRISGCMKRNG